MGPTLSDILLAGTRPGFVASGLGGAQERPSAASLALLLICAGEQAGRTLEATLRENAEAKALLDSAAARLAAPVRAIPADPIGANTALKMQLAALLPAVEAEPADWARRLEQRIWALLAAGAGARA